MAVGGCGPSWFSRALWLCSWLAAAAACSGTIEDPNTGGPLDPDAPSGSAAGSGGGTAAVGGAAGGGGGGAAPVSADCKTGQPPATTRLGRLNKQQYDNHISSLTELAQQSDT